ncbi:DUF1631 family protein [Marinobacteraceae bacterium S3BR75-40.1]
MSLIETIINQLRVPDLPYPVKRQASEDAPDWTPVLAHAWRSQTDKTVIAVLKQHPDPFTLRAVNAAYLADRIMDIYLQKSGLHATLVTRVARLRFWLAGDLALKGEDAVATASPVRQWLDSLSELRGWSDTGGRSARRLLEKLDQLVDVVGQAFETGDTAGLDQYVAQWQADQDKQQERVEKLRKRLLETEQGAALQRAADGKAWALMGQLLRQRQLPAAVSDFLKTDWQPLLRQIAYKQGTGSDQWRHARRAMEWLIWAMDPALSNKERDKLYQVGEKLTDTLQQVWRSASDTPPPMEDLGVIQSLLVLRLRGESPEVEPVEIPEHDPEWLQVDSMDTQDFAELTGQWFVTGEGASEERRYLFAIFPESGEALWTNGQGVKLGVESLLAVQEQLRDETLALLPPARHFQQVLDDTLNGLAKVLEAQKRQRDAARAKAQAQAEALRREREEAERRETEAAERERQAEAERQRQAQQAEEEAEQAKQEARARDLLKEVDALELGGWIEVISDGEKQKLKLAVRINASGKLVFVDRLGLNRQEINRMELRDRLAAGEARILSQGAEFADTLSRVVGRIRVGK